MDELNIGTTISRLRKNKCITQEQLASMIGVSGGAVSKWETGNSTPDICLLSPLARALDTSLDELLSFQRELSDTEIKKIKQELIELFLHCGFSEGEVKCMEYLNKYPNSAGLKLTIAGLFQMYSMMLGNDYDKLVKEKKHYALSLLYKVVESKDSRYMNIALFFISSIQMQMENYDESEKCLKELCNSYVDPMVLYASLLQKQDKNKEAENLCKSMLLQYINQGIAMMTMLSNINIKNNDFNKSAFYLETANQIQNVFKIGLGSSSYNLCRLYIQQGKNGLAAKWFKKYVDELLSSEYDYSNNPYFENLKLEVNPSGQEIIRKKMLQMLIDEEETKVLSGMPEYTEAIEKLKCFLKEC